MDVTQTPDTSADLKPESALLQMKKDQTKKDSYLSRLGLYYSLSQTFCVLHCISQSTIVSKKHGKNLL